MFLFADKARSLLTGSVTSAAGQVAPITTTTGALFVGVGNVATTTAMPMSCVMTAVDGNGNDTGPIEIVSITRSADNLTLITRGLFGTTAQAWPAGTVIECRPIAGAFSGTYPRLLYAGQGQLGVVGTNVMVSLLPGGTALSIPIGFPQVGDVFRVISMVRKTGTTAGAFYDHKFGGTAIWGGVGDSVTSKGHTLYTDVAIHSTTVQTITSQRVRGDSSGAIQSGIETTINTATTALDIDIIVQTDATSTVSLSHYSVQLLRAA